MTRAAVSVVHVRPRLHRALARQLGDQHPPVGPHLGRVDVLERAGVAVDARHVHPALVRERVRPHVRLVRVRRDVAELVHQVGGLGEPTQPVAPDRLMPELQLQGRDDRDQVRVAAPLAVAVHRPLHQPRARLYRHERVRHAAARVVVGVDADLDRVAELGHHARRGRAHVGRQRRAVRVAQRHVLGAGLGGRAHAAQGVVGVVAEGVEEVLGVVDHALALARQEAPPSPRSSAGSPRDPPA